jgi:hypothetical protein
MMKGKRALSSEPKDNTRRGICQTKKSSDVPMSLLLVKIVSHVYGFSGE